MVDIKPFSLLLADHVWKLTPTGILESGSMRVSTTMFIYLSVILSIGLLSYRLVIHLSVHISVSVPIHLSLHMFTMHLASVCPLVCLLMSLFPTILQKIVSGLQKTHTINRLYTCMSIHRRGGEMRNWEWQEGNKPTLYWKDISWCWHS